MMDRLWPILTMLFLAVFVTAGVAAGAEPLDTCHRAPTGQMLLAGPNAGSVTDARDDMRIAAATDHPGEHRHDDPGTHEHEPGHEPRHDHRACVDCGCFPCSGVSVQLLPDHGQVVLQLAARRVIGPARNAATRQLRLRFSLLRPPRILV